MIKGLYNEDDMDLNDEKYPPVNDEENEISDGSNEMSGYSDEGGVRHYETLEEAGEQETGSSARSLLLYFSYSVVFVTLIALTYFLYEVKVALDDPNVPNNVYFLNENLGGTNYKNLEKTIAGIALKISQRPLYLNAGERQFVINPARDIDFKVNTPVITDRIMKIGNEGNLLQRVKYKMRLKTGRMKVSAPCQYFFNKTKLETLSASISEYLNISPKSSSVLEQDNGMRRLTRETSGMRVTPEEIYRQIQSELSNFNSQNLGCVNLQYEEVKPSITVADKLKQLNATDLLAEFETTFNVNNPSVKENVEKASEKIDGLILKPLEVFSFNKAVGPTKYKNEADAKIFNSREIGYFPDISGGIGVFSSCLYNAILGTTIEVLERYNHTSVDAKTAYCPLGRDAQIIYGSRDLKFMVPKNSSPVIIFSEVSLNKLKVSIYSQNRLGETVRLETQEVNIVKPAEKRMKDYSMKKGEETVDQEGVPGYEIKTLKIVSANGSEYYRNIISSDMYSSAPKVIRVGDSGDE